MKSTNLNKLINYYNERQLRKVSFPSEIKEDTANSKALSFMNQISQFHNNLHLLNMRNERQSLYLRSQLSQLGLNYLQYSQAKEEKKRLPSKREASSQTKQRLDGNYSLPIINNTHVKESLLKSSKSFHNNLNVTKEQISITLPQVIFSEKVENEAELKIGDKQVVEGEEFKEEIKPNESEIILHDLNGNLIKELNSICKLTDPKALSLFKEEIAKIKEDMKDIQAAFNEIKSIKNQIHLKRALQSNPPDKPSTNPNQNQFNSSNFHNLYLKMHLRDPFAPSKQLSFLIDQRLKQSKQQSDSIYNQLSQHQFA